LLDLFLVNMGGTLIERTGMTGALRGLGLIIPWNKTKHGETLRFTARFVLKAAQTISYVNLFMHGRSGSHEGNRYDHIRLITPMAGS
jgi:hypothetical protein